MAQKLVIMRKKKDKPKAKGMMVKKEDEKYAITKRK